MFLFAKCFKKTIHKKKPSSQEGTPVLKPACRRLRDSLIDETYINESEIIPHNELYLLGKNHPIFVKITNSKDKIPRHTTPFTPRRKRSKKNMTLNTKSSSHYFQKF